MHWIVQENLYREEGFSTLMETFERFDIPYTLVKVVPFSDEAPPEEQLIPNVNPEGPVTICGSLTLAKIAKTRGWITFHNDDHDYCKWLEHYGDNLLNPNSVVCKFGELEKPPYDPFFCRPTSDSKTFSGGMKWWDEFNDWRHRVLNLGEGYTSLDYNTIIAASEPKVIYKEYRFFVVDGVIVGKSTYKIGTKVVYEALVDDGATIFAQEMIDLWQPARAFVIDVAMVDDGFKVVEINAAQSAGFYAIDVAAWVMAINEMEF